MLGTERDVTTSPVWMEK